jgi:hypothetical protein
MRRALVLLAVAACGDDGSSAAPADAAISDAPNTTTAVVAMLNATRTLDHAAYGINADDVHKGGFTGCPEMTSGQPDYTLILPRIPALTATSATTTAPFLDFIGDMTDSNPAPSTASAVSLTAITYSVGVYLSFHVSLTYPEGTAAGPVYAPYCPSLDG